jgi:hypothetical protein
MKIMNASYFLLNNLLSRSVAPNLFWGPPTYDLRRHLSWYCTRRINHAKAYCSRHYCLYADLSGPQNKFGATPSRVIDQCKEGKELMVSINELLDLYNCEPRSFQSLAMTNPREINLCGEGKKS